MTTEVLWLNIEIDHVRQTYSFDVSNIEELKKAFDSVNTRPILKEDHQSKGTSSVLLALRLQFKKSYHFLKLKEKRFIQKSLRWNLFISSEKFHETNPTIDTFVGDTWSSDLMDIVDYNP